MSGAVRVDRDGAVAVVTVDNPPVNALGNAILEALGEAARSLAADGSVRAVVLAGAGEKAFLAGADLDQFRGFLDTPGAIEEHVGISRRALDALVALPQPLVGALQASAVGGGLEVALCCDLLVADPAARLGLPEVRLALMPGAGGTQRLPRRIGTGRATELLLLGSTVDAAEALRIGLVNRVCEPGCALAAATELAGRLAGLPRVAVRAIKQAVAADLGQALDRERELFLGLFATEDVHEGVGAFLEKRKPDFKHR